MFCSSFFLSFFCKIIVCLFVGLFKEVEVITNVVVAGQQLLIALAEFSVIV